MRSLHPGCDPQARPGLIEVHLVDGRRSARPGEAALAHDEANGARAVAAMEPALRRQAAARGAAQPRLLACDAELTQA
jgi:hypothetical protein